MSFLAGMARTVAGLFVDDGFLAAGVLAIVALAVLLAVPLHAPGLVVGAVLVAGPAAILLLSIFRAERKNR
jgi:hypothetical protein